MYLVCYCFGWTKDITVIIYFRFCCDICLPLLKILFLTVADIYRIISMLYFVQGDIFSAPVSYSLGHCVSKDTNHGMFKGIAVSFLRHFPELGVLRKLDVVLGSAEPVRIGQKFIYNLVTKRYFWSKPSTSSLRSCLLSMKTHASYHGVKNIAVPLLASGCDRMNFQVDVYPLLADLFFTSEISLHIFSLTPIHRYECLCTGLSNYSQIWGFTRTWG